MQDTLQHLYKILNVIESNNCSFLTIYVAIGSAANCTIQDQITGNWTLDPKSEQQFPPFLKKLKEHFTVSPIHIILIDPVLENPPFIVCNNKKQLNQSWKKIQCDESFYYFRDEITNVNVYPINNYVHYINYINFHGDENSTNIRSFFDTLNNKSILYNWFIVAQDYCGRNIGELGEIYDKMLTGHMNHIIYGIGARLDGGCFIDITLPICNFVYQINRNGISVFNPFNFNEIEQLYSTINSLKCIDNDDYIVAKSQVDSFIDEKVTMLSSNIIGTIRQVGLLKKGVNTQLYDVSINIIDKKFDLNVTNFVDKGEYDIVLDKLYKILTIGLIACLMKIFDNKEQCAIEVNKAVFVMRTEQDPYKISYHTKPLFDLLRNKN